MTSLFDSFPLGSLTLPNRLVMAPMTRARATADGIPAELTATYYAQRATAGLIVTEGVQPSRTGQSNPNTPGLHTDEQVAAWRPVTDAVHTNGGRVFAQLMHAGRVGHPDVAGHHPVAPSAIALDAALYTGPKGRQAAPVPRALSTAEVRDEVRVFADAARRAVDAGFDGVELHGANGYFIQQFLATNTNHRTDAYGGSLTGRIRFAVEATEAAAEAIGADRVGLRLSPGGSVWGIVEDDVPELYGALVAALAPLGLAYLHVLTGTEEDTLVALRKAWPGAFIVNPGGQIGPTPGDRAAGEHWLAQGADLISYGRAYLANPDLVERFRAGLPLATADPDTWYQGGAKGFATYTGYQH
ncbi:alkene reductase [Streptomyces flavofungini]|uniref:Alkene reductase n=1 Tax=Streptomyces flavofungini TaxID=68200 RepID=A0ABS0X900_9ACTN|nr:alkene reductase [Streptomyces flavofungini]MBJ3809449.1 alkene reductase [Streptomyces flavofungini]GHC78340.1 alkene reductase [Streptomyces flavofungini]